MHQIKQLETRTYTPSIYLSIYLSAFRPQYRRRHRRRRRIEQEQGDVERIVVDLSSYLTCIDLEKIVMDTVPQLKRGVS
ncbi:hypothetical protein SORBI_3004G347000 [Sorghum bicolor]|uniref:Uncharacterized protein n=1 Tax=Sorghum bicolor TaxID=4558 RepID=A0A1Z5RQD5_SORBI|nr:hypothetical protein SORBI_3004G347000 [Sorghum bicolor]